MNNNLVGDIAITNVSAPSTVTVGERVDITVSLTNVGTETVIGSTFPSVRPGTPSIFSNFFLSSDDQLDPTDQQVDRTQFFVSQLPIDPGETITRPFSIAFNESQVGDLTGDQFLIVNSGDGEFAGVNGVNTENNIFVVPINIESEDSEPSVIRGTAGADSLVGTSGADEILGLAGNDTISAGDGNDTLRGGDGRDRLFSEGGDDRIFGGNDNDNLVGRDGNDTLAGNAGKDVLIGNSGNDVLIGGGNNDNLFAGDGKDTLFGNTGNDFLAGQRGDDVLFGNIGNDTLYGGVGNDALSGGTGNDVFELTRGIDVGVDRVKDYVDGVDKFQLSDRFGLGSLEFSDLTITQNGNNAQIRITDNNQLLAVVENTNANQLGSNDFIVG
ncbi:MAG: calcium-binding protein [Cyanobacteria bacterium P01_F01_bin.143]